MTSKVVGEGTYGCVVEPAIECKKPENYENKVSKEMKKKDALEELKEYEAQDVDTPEDWIMLELKYNLKK